MEVVLVEAAQEASEALLDIWAVEEGADLEALKPSTQILLWARLDVLAELLAVIHTRQILRR